MQVRGGENGNPSRFRLSPVGRELIRVDWGCPHGGWCLSGRIHAVFTGNDAYPHGLEGFPVGTRVRILISYNSVSFFCLFMGS